MELRLITLLIRAEFAKNVDPGGPITYGFRDVANTPFNLFSVPL